MKERTIVPGPSAALRNATFLAVPYLASGSQGPGWRQQLAAWTVKPGEDARTIRVVGCFKGSTKNAAWFLRARIEYRIAGVEQVEVFRWPSSGWSRLITADEVRVYVERYTLGIIPEIGPNPPTGQTGVPGGVGWTVGAAVMSGPLGKTVIARTVDIHSGLSPVVATRIPIGATRVRLDLDTGDYGALAAGWCFDSLGAEKRPSDNAFAEEDFAFFPNLAAGVMVEQVYASEMFADWRTVDDMAGAVGCQALEDPEPQRWRWLFEVS